MASITSKRINIGPASSLAAPASEYSVAELTERWAPHLPEVTSAVWQEFLAYGCHIGCLGDHDREDDLPRQPRDPADA